jgi:predicted metal-dependent RNase
MRLRDLKQKEVEYTKAGKFIEAEYTQNQIKALKEQIKARAEKTARVQDKENKKHIEEQCRKELEVFHTEWDRRIKEHVQNAKRAE